MIAIASTSASQFDLSDVELIKSIKGEESMGTPELEVIVEKLGMIREANENIQYVYIMRQTDDPLVVEFVADADTLVPEEELDMNEDGVLQEDEMVPWPGDPYDVSEFPVLKNEAFDHPSVDEELQPDQWGLIMAAYAPILDAEGKTVAIVGIDVLVDDFNTKTQETLMPFLLFVVLLIILLMLLTLMLSRVWSEKVEVMKELDRQKDELLSIVSHQLATPISSIKWYLEMMMDGDMGKLTKEQEENVSSLQYSAVNLADLVSMILDVSRIQLGRMKVDRTDLNTKKFFTEVAKALDAKAAEKNITFEKNIPEDLPVAMLDQRLMRMTLENLLSNAIKYTPKKGTVTLNVEVRDNKIFYEVKDSGCGIPKKEQDQIFEKLFRACNVGKVDGNGFGLYVAKGAVEAQGGTISFTSSQNKGTTFKVMLPVQKPSAKKKKS
jgi:signal transduction histidine kinase